MVGAFQCFRGCFQGKMVGTADSEDFSYTSKCNVQTLNTVYVLCFAVDLVWHISRVDGHSRN